ncbi:MAG: hypothetical protein ACAH59_11645 [Pseudobdellovibrionaceae bacterium]
MELYRPAGVPIWKKILKSPILHVSLVFVMVLVSILYVRQKQREELRARVEYLRGGPLLVERGKKPVQIDASSEAKEQLAPPQVAAAADGAKKNLEVTNASGELPAGSLAARSATSNPAGPASTGNPNPAAFPAKINVYYMEVETATLNSWIEESKASNQIRQFDDVLTGPLLQVKQKIRAAKGLKLLQKIDLNISTPGAPAEWFAGTHKGSDPESEMGFFSSLVMGDSRDGLIRGEIEVQRAFRDPNDVAKTMERISYGGPFELASGQGFFMRGLLPRKFATDFEEETHPDAYLTIFKSRNYREGQTEFTLILDFDTTSPQAR